ncbi:hypothetical protein C8Q76DRAFT_755556 [Earliella scabrosa]|nr:hypothetical protein C8Q76DRAFT_755556 [Earliella scabrosa]
MCHHIVQWMMVTTGTHETSPAGPLVLGLHLPSTHTRPSTVLPRLRHLRRKREHMHAVRTRSG